MRKNYWKPFKNCKQKLIIPKKWYGYQNIGIFEDADYAAMVEIWVRTTPKWKKKSFFDLFGGKIVEKKFPQNVFFLSFWRGFNLKTTTPA